MYAGQSEAEGQVSEHPGAAKGQPHSTSAAPQGQTSVCPLQLRVACVTWNMGRCKVSDSLPAQLPGTFFGHATATHQKSCTAVPDVLIVGTQETTDAQMWFDVLSKQLVASSQYSVPGGFSVTSAPGGSFCMTVAVFAHSGVLPWLRDVQVGRVTCGMGNKVRSVALLHHLFPPHTGDHRHVKSFDT